MMSPLAKEASGSGMTSPRRTLNNSTSSPRTMKSLLSKGSPQVMQANDDTSEKEFLARRSAKWTPAQPPQANLSEHYSMCLKLSAENKISIKNAFELHLIDSMGDMLLKQHGEIDFNLAAYSLDAGTKIYSCRIDALHKKVIKCLNSLTMKGTPAGDDDDDDDADDGGVVEPNHEEPGSGASKKKEEEKKKKKKKKKKTMVNQGETKSITIDTNSISCQQIDPLFDKFMQMTKVSCANNLLLSQIHILNDTHRPIFHNEDPIPIYCGDMDDGDDGRSGVVIGGEGCLNGCQWGADGGAVVHQLGCATASKHNRKRVNFDRFKDAMLGSMDDSKMICSTLNNFQFNDHGSTSLDQFRLKKHRFDSINDQPMSDNEDHYEEDYGGGDDDDCEDADYIRNISGLVDNNNLSMQNNGNLPLSRELSKTDFQQLNSTINSIKEGDLSSLKAALIRGQDGVSYFKEDFLKIWSGPHLWKDRAARASRPIGPANKIVKKAKERVLISFDDDDDVMTNEEERRKKKKKKLQLEIGSIQWHFQSTNLTRPKIEGTSDLLPEPFTSYQDRLYAPFILRDVNLEIQPPSQGKLLEIRDFDYDNVNDKLNYCPPPAMNGGDYDDDDNVGGFEGCGDDDDYPNNNNTLTLENVDAAKNNDNPQIFGDNNNFVGGGDEDDDDDDILTGSRLLPRPGAVMPLKIDYSKIAKNVDVKVMKETMIEKMDREATQNGGDLRMELSKLFRLVVEELPRKEANDFSVAMAVSCLLQISNEKNLILEDRKKFDDVLISGSTDDSNMC